MLRGLLGRIWADRIEGYEHPDLVETVFRKTVAYRPDREWPEISGARTVLDFGGACGAHYKLAQSSSVRWAVVETPTMVKRAKELEIDHLKFFSSTKDAADWLGSIDVMHSSGAIQYTPCPESVLRELCSLNAKKMLWHHMLLSSHTTRETQVSRLQDNGPAVARVKVRRAFVTYVRTPISEDVFLQQHRSYQLEARGQDWFRFVRESAESCSQ